MSQQIGELVSKQAVDTLVDELARAISDERCFMSRGRDTSTIMQDILDLPPKDRSVQDFVDKCRECGARYGKLLKDAISREWLMECVNEGWIKFDTEKDKNRFIHLVRDIAPQWIETTFPVEFKESEEV